MDVYHIIADLEHLATDLRRDVAIADSSQLDVYVGRAKAIVRDLEELQA